MFWFTILTKFSKATVIAISHFSDDLYKYAKPVLLLYPEAVRMKMRFQVRRKCFLRLLLRPRMKPKLNAACITFYLMETRGRRATALLTNL